MNSRVMILLAVLLVLGASIAGYMGYRTTQNAQDAAHAAEQKAVAAQKAAEAGVAGKVAVVAARQDIPAYKKLTADDLTQEYLTVAPPNTFQTIQELVGQTVQTPLPRGSLLHHIDLLPGGDMARLLQPGERAVAIPVDELSSSGGYVQPGDRVDVLLFLHGMNGGPDSAQIVMQSMRVLGMGSQMVSQTGGVQAPDQQPGQNNNANTGAHARTAVLAVAEKDVTRVLLASSLGTLRLAIHPPAEPDIPVENLPPLPGQAQLAAQGKPGIGTATAKSSDVQVPTQAQRQLLMASVLQPYTPPVAQAAAPRAPGTRHESRTPVGPVVIIFRGLQAQKVSP